MKQCVIGIDLGTSACKVLALSEHLKIIAESTAKYSTHVPRPGWSEQNPIDWWEATRSALEEVTIQLKEKGYEISGIGLTGQMHSLVLLDKEGNILRPSILWNDQRNYEQCKKAIEKLGGLEEVIRMINNGILTGVTVGKILWVIENEPHIFSKVYKFLVPKDFIRFKLTGEYVMDVSDASGTHMFDVKNRQWCYELINKLEIPEKILPERVVESAEVSGVVKKSVADLFDWDGDIPVVGGGADVVVQSVSSGSTSSEKLCLIVGTAGIVAITMDEFIKNSDGILQFYCNVIPSKYIIYGCTLAAGGSLEWLKSATCETEEIVARALGKSVFEIMSAEAEKSPVGSGGIIFLPFLSGERAPHPDPNARGLFIGLHLKSSKNDIIRSILEGVAYSLRSVSELMMKIGKLKIKEVYLTGGGTMSELWRQIFSDVFGTTVKTLRYSEKGGAFGAAALAGVGVGIWKNIEQVVNMLELTHVNNPIQENVEKYDRLYNIYTNLYPTLKKVFDMVAKEF